MFRQKSINRLLDKAQPLLTQQAFEPDKIAEILSTTFKRYRIYFSWSQNQLVNRGYVNICGRFYENENTSRIEVSLVFNPSQKKIRLNKSGYDDLKFRISQTIQHELIHKIQSQFRSLTEETLRTLKWSSKSKLTLEDMSDAEYYALPHEIEAHAHDIVLELTKTVGPDISNKQLNNIRFLRRHSITYHSYSTTYKNWKTHPIHKSLMLHINKYLRQGTCWAP